MKLYSVPGSHPSWAARLMLDRKGVSYRRVDLIAVTAAARASLPRHDRAGAQRRRAPGTGLPEISRAVDEMRPDPPLFPRGPTRRAVVEKAERWGDEVLQSPAKRLAWWAIGRDKISIRGLLHGARLGVPTGAAARTAAPIVWAEIRANGAFDSEADLAALPSMLDRVDGWIAESLLGGEEPNAAGFQELRW